MMLNSNSKKNYTPALANSPLTQSMSEFTITAQNSNK